MATEAFSQCGYAAASTRNIAAAAGVRSPALNYYFGNKRGLYRACMEAVVDQITGRIVSALAEAERAAALASTNRQRIAIFCRLQDKLIDSCFEEDLAMIVTRLINWEDLEGASDEAKRLLRERVDLPIFRTMMELVRAIAGAPPDDVSVGVRIFALYGGYAVFFLDTRRVHDAEQWSRAAMSRVETIKAVMREHSAWVLGKLGSRRVAPRAS